MHEKQIMFFLSFGRVVVLFVVFAAFFVWGGFVSAGHFNPVEKISPAADAEISPEGVVFSWEMISGANRGYEYCINPPPPGQGEPCDFTRNAASTEIVFDLEPNTEYQWNVRGCHNRFSSLPGPGLPGTRDCGDWDGHLVFFFTTTGLTPDPDPSPDPSPGPGPSPDPDPSPGPGPLGGDFWNPLPYDSFIELLFGVLNFLLALAIFILPIIIVIGGFMWMTAAGDPGRVSKGRTILTWGIIGFVVVLLSRGLIEVIMNTLGADFDW